MVTTNDHLLQEINNHKRELKAATVSSNSLRYATNGNSSDVDLYSPTVSTHETNNYSQSTQKAAIRKQFDQLNNGLNNRYGYSKC